MMLKAFYYNGVAHAPKLMLHTQMMLHALK